MTIEQMQEQLDRLDGDSTMMASVPVLHNLLAVAKAAKGLTSATFNNRPDLAYEFALEVAGALARLEAQ